MDDDSRRLVHDEQMLVLVRDPERQLLRSERRGAGVARLEAQLLPTREPVALRSRLSVDECGAARQKPLRLGS
jgi:hypothetical protein